MQKVIEHQCTRCAGRHRLAECTAPELPFPYSVLGHPAVGVYLSPGKVEIGHP